MSKNWTVPKIEKTDSYLLILAIVIIVMTSLGLQSFKDGDWKEGTTKTVSRNKKMMHCSLGIGIGILMFVLFRKLVGIKPFVLFGVVIMVISVYTIKQYEQIEDESCLKKIDDSYNYMYSLSGLASSMILFGSIEWIMQKMNMTDKNSDENSHKNSDQILLIVGSLIVIFVASVSIDTSNKNKKEDPYKILMVLLLTFAILQIIIVSYFKLAPSADKKKTMMAFSMNDGTSSSSLSNMDLSSKEGSYSSSF